MSCHIKAVRYWACREELGCSQVKQIKTGQRSHLNGQSTEKRSIIYASSKIEQARIHREQMEKIDAVGKDAMFGDEDLAFDLHLETFGVNIATLKEPAVQCVFRAYVEDWEHEDRKKNDCVAEARLIMKNKGLFLWICTS